MRIQLVTFLAVGFLVPFVNCSAPSLDTTAAAAGSVGVRTSPSSQSAVDRALEQHALMRSPHETEPTDEAPPWPATVSIAATGDLLVTRRVVKVWRDMGPDGIDQMLAGYRRVLRNDHIATLNLETPLVNDVNRTLPGSPPLPPILGAPPETASALSRTGVDLVSVANNHVYDQGFIGLERTLGLLDSVGIQYAGVGNSREDSYRPTVIRQGEVRVAFLSMTGLVNGRSARRGVHRVFVAGLFVEERVLAAIRAARDDADVVVVCVHWSTDFVSGATGMQRRLARRMVDAGADLILGTGPHVLHEVERMTSDRGDAVVAYSLGNLLSAMALRYQVGGHVNPHSEPSRVRPEGRDGVVLRVRFEVSHPSTEPTSHQPGQTLRATTLEAVPLWTHNNYAENQTHGEPFEIRVVPLSEVPAALARERRTRIAEALGDEVDLL